MKSFIVALMLISAAVLISGQSNAPSGQNPGSNAKPIPADLPEEYGFYFQSAQGWQRLHLTQAAKHEQKQSGFTQWTGMTMNGPSYHIKVLYAGGQAQFRIQSPRPTFYVRVSEASKLENLVLFRFKEKKDKRELETVQTSAERTGGGEQRAKAVGGQLAVKRLGPELFLATPEDDLTPGQYILTADNGSTGYDFGITQ